jgi:FixJ family two-component response regulator
MMISSPAQSRCDRCAPAAVADMRVLVAGECAGAVCASRQAAGFKHVDIAFNGRDRLATHAERADAPINLNRRMPPVDGAEARARLRARGEEVAVIMTAAGHLDAHAVLSFGVREIVDKPFSASDPIASVAQALNVERHTQSLPEPGPGGSA